MNYLTTLKPLEGGMGAAKGGVATRPGEWQGRFRLVCP